MYTLLYKYLPNNYNHDKYFNIIYILIILYHSKSPTKEQIITL